MLACSYCGSVQAPGWWSTPLFLGLAGLVAIGLVVAFRATGTAGRTRVGWLCLAGALVVPLPLAAVVAGRTTTSVEVVSSSPPGDAPAWSVDCVTAFQGTAPGVVNAEFAAACGDATRVERWTAYGLFLAAVGLGAFGTVLLVTADGTRRRADGVDRVPEPADP